MVPFTFGAPRDTGRVAETIYIPIGIQSESTLFEELYTRMRLPDYFGSNWDALDECVRDLSWFPPGQIVLIHKDLPFEKDDKNLRIYLSVLNGAVRKLSSEDNWRLQVVFPADTRDRIACLLRDDRF